MRPWWSLSTDELCATMRTDCACGLSTAEARERLASSGRNELAVEKRKSALGLLASQFTGFIVWVLVGAAVVSGLLREWVDALAIIGIVILNGILGFIQEYRAEKAMSALKKLAAPSSKVIREGKPAVIPSTELVPGDLLELESGDMVPADARLIYVTCNFSTREASLTGESTPVAKTALPVSQETLPLADRANMVFMGTSAAAGKARAIVVETGPRTELGRVAGLIASMEDESTPLQKRLAAFGHWIVYFCFFLVFLVFGLELLRGGNPLDMFLTAVSLAVAAIPEGLPAVVTIALALGVQRMVKRNALIRKLPSVETLGCTTVICSDKTGTLTRNEMTVQRIFAGNTIVAVSGLGYDPAGEFFTAEGRRLGIADLPEARKAILCGVLCNGAALTNENGRYAVIGDPTEGALLTLGGKAGLCKQALEAEYPFVAEIPFDSERRMMTMMRRHGQSTVAWVKGAPEAMLAACTRIEQGGRVVPLTDGEKSRILEVNAGFAGEALRVLAVGWRDLEPSPAAGESAAVETDLVFAGLLAMIDPPREEAGRAVQACASAGIRTVMITGDHKHTALAIARRLGIAATDSQGLSGDDLDGLSDPELDRYTQRISVYARVSPEHKLRIVRSLRSQGQVVAMTGDGVNDAPAVKEADIGVAMGITGTDVTKEVADMIITDDNFASIVAAVEEGRGIYDNIRKFIHYLLSCNIGEILVMFVAALFGWPVPLLPVQILWVNLVTDGLPALALGMEPIDPDIMKQKPRPGNEPVATRSAVLQMLAQGAFIALCGLGAFGFVLYIEQGSIDRARTAAFIVLACSQLFHAFNCRSRDKSLFRMGVFSNRTLILANGISFLLQLGVVYLPFLQHIFRTTPLTLSDWAMIIMVSSFPLWAVEMVKLARRRTAIKQSGIAPTP
ncbi:MAG: calcium-translocating P-type ATPase, SERCA-type [Thermodesulfobacteriota bacterium]